MADFIVSEAEESEDELSEKKSKRREKLTKHKAAADSSEDEEDDDEEEVKDLIDDNSIEDESDSESDDDVAGVKRKRDDDDDEMDDQLCDEDLELLEENTGEKFKRKKRFVRVKRMEDESDEEGHESGGERDAIANQLFEESDAEDRGRGSKVGSRSDDEGFDSDKYSDEEDDDFCDFIVDADGRPIHEKRQKRKPIHVDAKLQQAQDLFGVDFDYDMENEEEVEEEEDEQGRKTRRVKKTKRKTIYEIYEPSELERGHFTDQDEQIRKADVPERMQLRQVPVTSVEEGSTELDSEAEWIYQHAFAKPSISTQDGDEGREKTRKGPKTVQKIRQALDLMRNQFLEVPFIAFYRKELVKPELNINDLWRVYKFDEKWTQLQTRKKNLMRLFEKMKRYQSERQTQDVEQTIPENARILKDEDLDRLKSAQSLEELNDIYSHFVLYFGDELPQMQEAFRQKGRDDLNVEEEKRDTVKQARRKDLYSLCSRAGLDGLVRNYGLTPEQFAENLRDNYQRHEVEQCPTGPSELAMEYVGAKFATASEVLKASNYMMAVRIARDPLVRQCVREAFYERAKINVTPTQKGLKEIDENHPLYTFRFLKGKPVRELVSDQFLLLMTSEQDKLVAVHFDTDIVGSTSSSFASEVKQLFHRDEFSRTVQEWNDVRSQVIDLALNKFIFPALVKELKSQLMNEAKEAVLKACSCQLYNWLKIAPYKIEYPLKGLEKEEKIRVMALSYVADLSQASFACLVSADGEVSNHIRLEHILKRKNAWKVSDRVGKEEDMAKLKKFIFDKKPRVIAIGCDSREALMLQEDLKNIVDVLVEEEHIPDIKIELVDNNLAKVFASSIVCENNFREYPQVLREAISVARRLLDPLAEFAQLCNKDDEILCLKYHPMQDQLAKEELLEALYVEFINRTNEVGVDINRAFKYPHTSNLVQFVCGFGPRKAQALMKILKILKQNNQMLENRTQLVTVCHLGPKMLINCSGFIKIDTNSLGDGTESFVDVLDGSRVHPETYEWARKMAIDALEYEDEDANPAGAVEEILETPEKLKQLDLDAFADELERQGFGDKSITLYDVRNELNDRYKDLRVPYQQPSQEEIFNMVTKETPETLYIGKLFTASVTGFAYRKPQREQLDPIRNELTGLWQCPFCFQNDLQDLTEVWHHFDGGACPGQVSGVKVRLENGLFGFIPMSCLSDRRVSNPEERVRPGQMIYCRVTKIDVERFSVTCTSKSSDLMDKSGRWRPPKDNFYDQAEEDKILKAEEDGKKLQHRQTYTTRVIIHPSFKNIGFQEAERLLVTMDQGEGIIRPSSKATDHLTVTWKVTDDIYQHVDIREERKENAFSLGKCLWIGDEQFEDLDEIMARYLNPMAAYARDLLSFRYFRNLGLTEQTYAPGKERELADKLIKEDQKKNPLKIHYFVSASREFPGRFMLTYLPRSESKHEFITVTHAGYRFRGQVFDNLDTLFCWFKEHFRDPIPGTPASRAPSAGSSRTPHVNLSAVNPVTLHRVAQSIPPHLLHSLSQAALFQGTPSQFGYPVQTPFMTPYANTPHPPQTPRYSGTPAPTTGGYSASSVPPGAAGISVHAMIQSGMFRTPATSGSGGHYSGSRTHTQGASGSSRPHNRGKSDEPTDWKKAAEAWAQSRTKTNSQQRNNFDSSRNTPRPAHNGRSTSGSDKSRSTPRSQTRLPSRGDATPLYDE